MKKKLQIGVIGSAGWEEYPKTKPEKRIYNLAFEVGKLIAKNNSILICGGKGGIMLEAAKGAKKLKGITVGVVSGSKRFESNKFIDVEVVSGITNFSEESMLISMCDGIISIGGGAGTLQELTLAYRSRKPVVILKNTGGWSEKIADSFLDEREKIKFDLAATPEEAFSILLRKIKMLS